MGIIPTEETTEIRRVPSEEGACGSCCAFQTGYSGIKIPLHFLLSYAEV